MSNLVERNILVTGGQGLVGSHLVEKLLTLSPARIICLSRSEYFDTYFFEQQLNKKVVLAYGDIRDKERVLDVVTKYEINSVFHIAAQPIVPTALINPYETFASNILGTIHVLEAVRQSSMVKVVVVASSDKVYGKNCDNASEANPLQGDHPYDVSKTCADLIAQTYYKTYGLPVVISRFGNIYGPGDLNFSRIIPGIMKSIIKNEMLELRSDGTFKRDYVYVKDVVDGYICLAENIEKIKGEAFNFSSGVNFSVLELIDSISENLNKEIKFKILDNQKNEIPRQSLNCEKVTRVLGWKSQYSFEDAIKETYAWYQKYFSK